MAARGEIPSSVSTAESGQASVELVAIIPALLVCALIAGQGVAAGWALWSAADSARLGARAEHVGGDGEAVARRALPGVLRRGAEVDEDSGDGAVRVGVRPPGLLPGLRTEPMRAAARLDPGDG